MTQPKQNPLRIIRLEAENVKRLKAVAITPKGDVIQITGANDNGKTSVLDSIWLVLDHNKVDAPVPVRKGEKKARIRLELGEAGKVELIVERRITADGGGGLVVESADGARLGSPQKVLDAMIGSLSFDPLAFTRMKEKEQFNELRRVANVEVDFDQLDAHNRGDFERRTEVNRQVKAKRGAHDSIVLPEAAGSPVNEAELLDKMQSASDHNAKVEKLKGSVNALEYKAVRLVDSAKRNREQAERLRHEAVVLEAAAATLETEASDLRKAASESTVPEMRDVTQLRADLDAARHKNAAHEVRRQATERREVLRHELEALEREAEGYTLAIEGRDKQKADAIRAAKMPVEGLGFGEGHVTYKGVPFQQASSAVQLRVSLAIAMAANPRLRLMFIRDGSLLDEKSMELVADMASKGDYQVWIERVDSSGKVGVYIEDGSVAAVDGKRQQTPLPM